MAFKWAVRSVRWLVLRLAPSSIAVSNRTTTEVECLMATALTAMAGHNKTNITGIRNEPQRASVTHFAFHCSF